MGFGLVNRGGPGAEAGLALRLVAFDEFLREDLGRVAAGVRFEAAVTVDRDRDQVRAFREAQGRLALERGLPLDGGTQRNSYVTSIQPTASTAFLCGEATPSIEPVAGNAYLQKTLSGSFLVKNKYLEALLEKKGINTPEVWQQIIATKGSVQYVEGLSDEEKAVFRTAYEMNMREIVRQAADRQPYIDQAQSLNVFFQTPVSGKYMHDVHFLAWKTGVKSLYYLRSSAPIEADKINMKVEKRNLETEECAVCQ